MTQTVQTRNEADGYPLGAHLFTYENCGVPGKESLLANLDQTGIVLIKGVSPGSEEQILRIGRLLGTTDVGIDNELLGPLIMHLRYRPGEGQENKLPAYFTSDFFPLHTDVSYVSNPPRFMLLHCVHPDPEGGGVSLLADCNRAFALLPEQERLTISQQVFNFLYPPNCCEGQSQAYAIFEGGLWRYKYSSMDFPEEAKPAVEDFNRVLTDISIPLSLERGDLLLIDNHRIVHGRTAFNQARSGSAGRHIMRLYATTREQGAEAG